MLKMIKGAKINCADKLNEEYVLEEDYLTANINADKILKIINDFVDLQTNPLFLIIEVPTSLNDEIVNENIMENTHKDVYYLDGMSNEFVKELLKTFGNLFINDGMAQIGVGNHITNAEIMSKKYNVITIFNGKDDKSKYEELMLNNEIKKVDSLTTAWSFFSKENPGFCNTIEEDGKNIYDAVEALKEAGLYFAERREDF